MHRLHVVSLPHTDTTPDFSSCAYTEKVRKFCTMMARREEGNQVFLYAGAENSARVTEHIPCISSAERKRMLKGAHYTTGFNTDAKHWSAFSYRVKQAMAKRVLPHDIICLIGGRTQKTIADAFPGNIVVEFGIGYAGHFSRFKVFESYAWMHAQYGQMGEHGSNDLSASWDDAVIPGMVEESRFPLVTKKQDFLLYVGRMTARKGLDVAVATAKAANIKLVTIGSGDYIPNAKTHLGELPTDKVAKWMGKARALICPTLYIEPFGNVAAEAQMCGTPIICTDWGAFTETVEHNVTGIRCRSLQQFKDAVANVVALNPVHIRERAVKKFGTEAVGHQFQNHFNRLSDLHRPEGWFTIHA